VDVKLSTVICTRNRPDTIGQALQSVAECDFEGYDIHIMDQSTDGKTREVVEELAARFAHKVPIVYHHLDQAGLSRAYNAGVRVSTGDIIACTDDDVVVPKGWLTEVQRAFDSDPSAGLIYGQVLVPESLKQAVADGVVVPAMYIKRRERLARGGKFRVDGMGANFALRRALWQQLAGFDEALGGGGPLRSSQDFDFAYRTYVSGWAVLFVPEVTVDHYGSRTEDQWPATLKAYGIGDGAFYSKHIRCGDLFACWLFGRVLARSAARQAKSLVLHRRFKDDAYAFNLFNGIRDGLKFDIDKSLRLYRESATGKMTVTDANAVTSAHRPK
jgi:glycosyltransferase involved in cell wall biosynthesis